MSESTGTLLSVRGSAQRNVSPDYVVLAGSLTLRRRSKVDALEAAAGELRALTGDLAQLGGVVLDENSERAELTWSARSAATHAERDHNKRTGQYELTGTIIATVALGITIRELDLLGRLGALLASHQHLDVHNTFWGVDEDNAVWPVVRAEAIRAALRKGHDYADALGGSIVQVQHIADVGLLGGGDDSLAYHVRGPAPAEAASLSGGSDGDTPSLDPVPQTLTATIEARLLAAGVSLSPSGA